jgi:hypothetical protein
MYKVKYEENLTITLTDDNIVESIGCNLPVIGEGNNRIVYDLGDKILKVAKTFDDALVNLWEVNLFNKIKDKKCRIKFNNIFEYDNNYLWYVAEKINISQMALEKAIELIPCLDYSDNAGYNQMNELTIVDADGLHWSWFINE